MTSTAVERLAEVVVDYSTAVRPGDLVLIEAPDLAAPLVRETFARVLSAGGHPLPRIAIEGVAETFALEATAEQLDWASPVREAEIEQADVRIVVDAAWNARSLATVEPARLARIGRARQPWRKRYLERAAAGELRWMLAAYPTNAAAQDAELSLADYERLVYCACLLDEPEPAARWQAFAAELDRVAAFLAAHDELRIVAEGTDLRARVGGRTWIASKGHENMPDGEVFTGPHETSVEGTIRFSYPAVFQRREVHDVRLRFEAGEVVEATAERGQSFLREMLAMDDGARRVGELAFGLNEHVKRFTKSILLDEKIGGTMHLALGSAYPETGGRNSSGLHWDMICDLRDGGEVYADGELVYRDGAFLTLSANGKG